jgi:hypothetical protein
LQVGVAPPVPELEALLLDAPWGDTTYGQGENGTMNNMSATPVPAVW